MNGQNFMYFAIGGSVILFTLFVCWALFHIVRILRDLGDASDSVKEAAEQMNVNLAKVSDRMIETADQISTIMIKPFTIMQFLTDKVKPVMDMIQKRYGQEDEDYEEEEPRRAPRKRKIFRKKK